MNRRNEHEREHEREWQVQERAMHDLRNGRAGSDDSLSLQYRQIGRALLRPVAPIPGGFAGSVARAAVMQAGERVPELESILLRGLCGLLVLSGLVVVWGHGSEWLPAFVQLLPGSPTATLNWALALSACLGLSWMLQRWADVFPGHGADSGKK